jgi:hypothetical protein
MPYSDEVLDQSAGALSVVADDQITIGVRQRSVNQDQGKAPAQQGQDAGPRSIASWREQKTFYAVSDEVLDVFAFQPQISLAIAKENPIAGLTSRAFRPPHDRREKRVHYVGDDDAYSLRLLRNEAARDPIGDIVERLDCLFDPLPGLRVYSPAPIDDARHGHRRNARPLRDFMQGCGHAIPMLGNNRSMLD